MPMRIPAYRAVLDLSEAASPADVAIIGDERHVEQRLRQLTEAGATHFIANLAGATTDRERQRTIEFLGAVQVISFDRSRSTLATSASASPPTRS